MSESATLFPETLFPLSYESEDSAVLFKLSKIFPGTHLCRRGYLCEFVRICHSICLLIFVLRTGLCTLSQTECQESSLPVEQGVQTYQILCGVMTPALMSVGPGF